MQLFLNNFITIKKFLTSLHSLLIVINIWPEKANDSKDHFVLQLGRKTYGLQVNTEV